MSETRALGLLFGIHTLFLLYGISQLSISYHEAVVFFQTEGVLHHLVRFSSALFGQNDWALRLPFVFIHLLSTLLLYKIAKPLLKRKIDRLFSVLIYLMLPGISAAALLVNEASLTILLTLLFVWLHQNNYRIVSLVVLCLSLAVDNSFAIFYLALFFYGIAVKDRSLFVIALILFGLSMSFYGFDTGGKPKGYFLDTFGVYAAAFSPLFFLYYMYAIYRIAIKEKKEILWYITFVAFAFSFLLSLRQQLMLEDFIPFAVIAVPLVVRVFFNSFRVRLPRHRCWHASLAMVVMFALSINFVMTIFNKPLYHLVKESDKHFVYNYHVAKELAQWLHDESIDAVDANDAKLQLRLQFYGVQSSKTLLLQEVANSEKTNQNDFLLSYAGKKIAHYRIFPKNPDRAIP
ncbi:glycosyltransferase family 39 protein [Sulfurospirillum sp. T05]|uniref:Glycosyltransferase family 39 protein n=1 Tax=Sulfurospirillum tamanense TaxID=2813362 RepID=A0ABS2WTQ8_9BACT|nr:glycosyltransferase family 39 protein [Sulfurospirillum tamanensis]MBN2965052.1 glycosyltransferase family 39 protein [Sulfurospirillum tamanensis]